MSTDSCRFVLVARTCNQFHSYYSWESVSPHTTSLQHKHHQKPFCYEFSLMQQFNDEFHEGYTGQFFIDSICLRIPGSHLTSVACLFPSLTSLFSCHLSTFSLMPLQKYVNCELRNSSWLYNLNTEVFFWRSRINFKSQLVCKTRTRSGAQKNGNFNICTGQAPSAEEDHVIQSKAPKRLLNGHYGHYGLYFNFGGSRLWWTVLRYTENKPVLSVQMFPFGSTWNS